MKTYFSEYQYLNGVLPNLVTEQEFNDHFYDVLQIGNQDGLGSARFSSALALQEGLPDSAKHPAHYKGRKCVGLKLSEKLIDRRGSRPHVRQAHFRFLSDERFTKKRNTYVLVKAGFVRGKCKIIVEVEDRKTLKGTQ